MYKQSIIVFGIVLPIVAIAAVIGGFHVVKSKMTASHAIKSEQYRIYSQSRNAAMEIEAKIGRQRPHLTRWKADLAAETTSTVRTHLKAIGEKLPSKEFQETAFDPINTKGGFGSSSLQKSSQLRLAFRGTYRSVQRALTDLESRMPQLQLQDLKIDPGNQSSLLNFQVTFTAWEN